MQKKIIESEDKRVERILTNPKERKKAHTDLVAIVESLGLTKNAANHFCEQIFAIYLSTKPIQERDQLAFQFVAQTKVNIDNNPTFILDIMSKKIGNRAAYVANQLTPYLTNVKGKVIDYGAGEGRVAQILHDNLALDIEGADVRNVRGPQITIPLFQFDGSRVPVEDKHYTTGIVSQVLHHDVDNEKILRELDRIVKHKLIIKETIPDGETTEEMLQNMDSTFIKDYLFNRIFRNCDIPAPGTFETPDGWKHRFAKYGWKVNYEKDLGFDLTFIRVRQYLFVFTRL